MESPEWTAEDRALLLALAMYEATLCPGCGHTKQQAWHRDLDGLWEVESWVCAACTATALADNPSAPQRVHSLTYPDPDRPGGLEALSPLVLGENTIEPEGART